MYFTFNVPTLHQKSVCAREHTDKQINSRSVLVLKLSMVGSDKFSEAIVLCAIT